MSNSVPRAIYWRRRLLLLAALILLTWVALQLWPEKDDPKPTASPSPQPSASVAPPTPTAAPTPPTESTTTVALKGGGNECDSQKIRISAFIADGQQAQRPVNVDLSIMTTAKKPCTFTPKTYDPLAVVNRGDKRVWDSSDCSEPVASATLQLVPGWSTVARIPWIPKKSGKACAAKEPWLAPGKYTLEVGTLGGEPGKATFQLAAPPPPPPPTPAPTAAPTTAPPAAATPAPPAPKPAG